MGDSSPAMARSHSEAEWQAPEFCNGCAYPNDCAYKIAVRPNERAQPTTALSTNDCANEAKLSTPALKIEEHFWGDSETYFTVANRPRV